MMRSSFLRVSHQDKPFSLTFFICCTTIPLSSKMVSSFCPYTNILTAHPCASNPTAKFLMLVPMPPEFPVFGGGIRGLKKRASPQPSWYRNASRACFVPKAFGPRNDGEVDLNLLRLLLASVYYLHVFVNHLINGKSFLY